MKLLKLTEENYYSAKADEQYMSVSQYKDFLRCERRALAKLRGEIVEEPTTSMLVGSYVDAYFEGTLDKFISDHPEICNIKFEETPDTVAMLKEVAPDFITRNDTIKSNKLSEAKQNYPECFNKTVTLKADYKQANDIIARILEDKKFTEAMSGKKQVIMTFNLFGTPWKIKMDSYFPDEKIVDLKIMADMLQKWKDGAYRSFVEAWGYDTQLAVYSEGEKIVTGRDSRLPVEIACATKEAVTNIELIGIGDWRLEECLEDISKNLPRILAVKNGEVEPTGCGVCDYCKSKKVLTEPIDFRLVGLSQKEINLMKGCI